MGIRVVLLDLDNTLFDHASSVHVGLKRLMQGYGVDVPVALAAQWFEIEDAVYSRETDSSAPQGTGSGCWCSHERKSAAAVHED
ncbi:hypothetical protein ART_0581 [Arthrobacter sp. PAMC 25486]|nr:hypothetical protein ART_0581 [Arthrobacter sp. PAMC 25486]